MSGNLNTPSNAMSQSRGRASRSLMWSVVETFGATGFSILAMILLARVLTIEQLSTGALAVLIIQLVALPFEILFHDTLVQRPDVTDVDISSAFVCTGVGALIAAVALFLFAPLVAQQYGSSQLSILLKVGVFAIPLAALSSVISATLRRKLAFAPLARRTIVGRLMGVLAGVVAAFWGGGAWSLLIMHVGSISIATAVLLSDRTCLPKLNFSKSAAAGMFGFALPNLFAQLMLAGNSRLFLAAFAAVSDVATFGRFSLAFRLVEELRNTLSAAASQLALPIFSRLAKDRDAFLRIFKEATSFSVLILLPLYAGFALLAPDLVVLIFGAKWVGMENIVQILCVSSMIVIMRQYSGVALNALGFPVANLKINATGFFASLFPFLIFSSIGSMAAGFIWCLRAVALLFFSVLGLRSIAKISIADQLKPLLSAVVGIAVMALVLALFIMPLLASTMAIVRLLVSVISGAIFYALTVYVVDKIVVMRLIDFVASAVRKKNSSVLK
jgi:PST family polysaccharide transporter